LKSILFLCFTYFFKPSNTTTRPKNAEKRERSKYFLKFTEKNVIWHIKNERLVCQSDLIRFHKTWFLFDLISSSSNYVSWQWVKLIRLVISFTNKKINENLQLKNKTTTTTTMFRFNTIWKNLCQIKNWIN